ncbi:MAG: glycosyltransferase family 1 protein [Acidobacteriota bacterium]
MSHVIAIDARKLGDFGIGTYIENLLRGLAALDAESRYVLFVSPEAEPPDLPGNFSTVTEASGLYSIRELFALSWRLHRLRPDLFHATHYVLPLRLPCATVVTIHDIIHLLFPDFLPNRFAEIYARLMIQRSLRSSDRVIAVSNNTREDLRRTFRVDPDKIDVIYNGVDPSFFEPSDADDAELQELGLEPGYVLFVGNPKPHKNLDRVLQAYAAARPKLERPVPMVCAGARRGSDGILRQKTEAMGIGDAVHWLGHVPEKQLRTLYRGAGLFVYPTLYEGFGLPVIEAMASGTPVITSNNSALREIAEGYAHLVSPLEVDEIEAAIVHCLNDREHARSLATLGRRRAADFRWAETARQTLDLYRSVLNENER